MNKLIWASINNPIGASNFRSYELVTAREYRDHNGEMYVDTVSRNCYTDQSAVDDVFYQILGHYHLDSARSPMVIGTYYNPKIAIRVLQDITGKEVEIYSI